MPPRRRVDAAVSVAVAGVAPRAAIAAAAVYAAAGIVAIAPGAPDPQVIQLRQGGGLRQWATQKVMENVMAKAGAGVPSANRITLLRDADGDGVAETKTTFAHEGLRQPFGMTLVGDKLYVANPEYAPELLDIVPRNGRRSKQLHHQVEDAPIGTGLHEGDQGKERRKDHERVEYVRKGAGEFLRADGHGG